jgi:hypothetical protein
LGWLGAIILIAGSLAHHRNCDNRVLVTCSFGGFVVSYAHDTVRGGVFLARYHTVSMMTYVNEVRVV